MDEVAIAIRNIQHYLYCPHRFGLIMIDDIWAENYFVTKANLIHERVHTENDYKNRNKRVITSLAIYNDAPEYNIYGYVDCIELEKDNNGVAIDDNNEKFKISIIEYKPTKPKVSKYNFEDLMQVFAQKICIDKIFKCNSEGIIYYKNTNERIKLDLNENYNMYDNRLKETLLEMRTIIKSGCIPMIKDLNHCGGCSFKDLCMPKTYNKNYNIVKEINKLEINYEKTP